ncbi:acetylornithine aminotransferase [Auricularia subglabra TFB-10046 SS5]|nr:acetylornithine aminotransferase [Auricularia subglabra TFB-10046 SS5]
MFRPTRAVFAAAAQAKYTANVARGVNHLSSAILASGKGSYVTTTEGKRLLDFTSGIGVTCLGHAHPKVSEAAAKQCMTLVHAQCSIAYHAPALQLVEKLLPIMPDPSLDTLFFTSTGAEAVEGAMKLARSATGRQNIIVMRGGYHGRSVGTMALTSSKTIYSAGFFPLMPGVFPTTFPYWHQMGLSPDTPSTELTKKALFDLSLILAQQSAPKDTAAILIEPVLGEGGYVPVPPEFLRGLREVCDQHGILLICDEVQSGFARTGKYFFTEYSGVRPDIMVMAKGIANGFPLSAIASSRALMDTQAPGSMGGTYAGNAVACAAAVAVAEAFQEERILENVQARSRQLFGALDALRKKPDVAPHILDVRGAGLMVGAEFASPAPPAHDVFARPDAPKNLATRISARCLEKGMLLLTTSVFETVRFIPPLNVSGKEMEEGCAIFSEAVEEVVREG